MQLAATALQRQQQQRRGGRNSGYNSDNDNTISVELVSV